MADRRNKLHESASQTAGPYVHIGCAPSFCGIEDVYGADPGATMVSEATKGQRITVTGIIHDGEDTPVLDAMVEIWQADAQGRYGQDAAFSGWGRQMADLETGEWRFETIKPGGGAPFITFWIVARGINLGLHTRMYFPDEDNTGDPALAAAGDRAATLVAEKTGDGAYRFDINLQGDRETVFFDI